MLRKIAFSILVTSALAATPCWADMALATSKNCMACHHPDRKVVGPAFREVAKRYINEPLALAALTTGHPGAVGRCALYVAGSPSFWREYAAGLTGYGQVSSDSDALPVLELATEAIEAALADAPGGAPALVAWRCTDRLAAARARAVAVDDWDEWVATGPAGDPPLDVPPRPNSTITFRTACLNCSVGQSTRKTPSIITPTRSATRSMSERLCELSKIVRPRR